MDRDRKEKKERKGTGSEKDKEIEDEVKMMDRGLAFFKFIAILSSVRFVQINVIFIYRYLFFVFVDGCNPFKRKSTLMWYFKW